MHDSDTCILSTAEPCDHYQADGSEKINEIDNEEATPSTSSMVPSERRIWTTRVALLLMLTNATSISIDAINLVVTPPLAPDRGLTRVDDPSYDTPFPRA